MNAIPETLHVGELRLRRFQAGEIAGREGDAIGDHVGTCPACRGRLERLADEQRAFAREIPFERFAGGVERAHRVPRPPVRRRAVVYGGFGGLVAAAAALLLFVRAPENRHNAVKGGGAVDVSIRIGRADGTTESQRNARAHEVVTLAPGERLRIAYRARAARHLAVVSIDERGEVSAIYPGAGTALLVQPSGDAVYLPDSVELFGAGRERVFAIVSAPPVSVDEIADGVRAAYAAAHGDLAATSLSPAAAWDVTSWLFVKPTPP